MQCNDFIWLDGHQKDGERERKKEQDGRGRRVGTHEWLNSWPTSTLALSCRDLYMWTFATGILVENVRSVLSLKNEINCSTSWEI